MFLNIAVGDLQDAIRKGQSKKVLGDMLGRIVSRIFCVARLTRICRWSRSWRASTRFRTVPTAESFRASALNDVRIISLWSTQTRPRCNGAYASGAKDLLLSTAKELKPEC